MLEIKITNNTEQERTQGSKSLNLYIQNSLNIYKYDVKCLTKT